MVYMIGMLAINGRLVGFDEDESVFPEEYPTLQDAMKAAWNAVRLASDWTFCGIRCVNMEEEEDEAEHKSGYAG